MEPGELQDLIRRGEDSYTEFKRGTIHPDDLAASIVAFANSGGGVLVLGVEDDRRVVGVADADATMRLVDNVSYQNVEPPLLCLQEKVMIGDRTVLVVRVPKGPERPYRTNRGVYYVRTSSGRRQATREELMRLYHTALAVFPDELPVPGTGVRHLNVGYFEEFFRRHYALAVEDTGVGLEQLLTSLKLLKDDQLTVAGLVLFGRRPQEALPFARISAVVFPGCEVGEEIVDRKELEGVLEEQINGARSFRDLHLRTGASIRGFRREDRPEIPAEVLREAVVNAGLPLLARSAAADSRTQRAVRSRGTISVVRRSTSLPCH